MEEIKRDSKIQVIANIDSLPTPGRLISYQDDDLEVAEKFRKQMLAWEVNNHSNPDLKLVWILCVKDAYMNNAHNQLIKNAEQKQYKIGKKALIEPNLLNMLYDKRTSAESQKSNADESIVVGKFEVILTDALNNNASDIHLEVREMAGVVRMRINGEMMEYDPENRMNYSDANNLCSVIYNVLASTKDVNFDPRECQQGEVNYNIRDQELKLRYQSVPAYPNGYDVVLRVLPVGRSEDFTPLQKLGYEEQQVEELINISSRPVGSLIIAGVTGSGKSTTLKNLLMYINANNGYRLKIYTIEDPPEYNIAKVTQIPVLIGKDKDLGQAQRSPFEKPIKACMRADPDLIMIGEVRDKMTGDLTQKAIQSGHQVLTTIHTTSAIGIIGRLEDFGLSRSTLGSPEFLTGLLYQKLLPRVCKACGLDFNGRMKNGDATQKDVDLYNRIVSLGVNPSEYPLKMRNKDGCKECKFSGIEGRTVCAEVIMLDLAMIELIREGKTIDLIKHWRKLSDGKVNSLNMRGKTCMEHAFQKMLRGLVSPHDVEASFKPLNEMLMATTEPEILPEVKSPATTLENHKEKLEIEGWTDI